MALTVDRIFPMLELGGSQLGQLRLAVALRARGVQTRFWAGCATQPALTLYARHGFDVACYKPTWEWGMEGPWRPDFAAWLTPRLAGAELIHAHHGAAWWQAVMAAPAEVPLVATEHSVPPYSRTVLDQLRDASPRLDRFYMLGPGVRKLAQDHRIPPGKQAPTLSPLVGLDAQPRPGLKSPRVVFAGRLAKTKRVDLLLDALALMVTPPQTYILGAGPEEQALRAQADLLGLGCVEFCGWQDEPERWVAGASVFVNPADREATGGAALQAMGLGVPVVGCATEGMPETLGYGTRGLLVAAGDADGLARAVEGVLSGELEVDVQSARRFARALTPERLAEQFERDYRALLRASASAKATVMSAR